VIVNAEASLPGVGVTAILPRRSYAPLLGRLLHDRTADKMAGVISNIPYAVATIVPFDVRRRVEALAARQAAGTGTEPSGAAPSGAAPPPPGKAPPGNAPAEKAPAGTPPAGAAPAGSAEPAGTGPAPAEAGAAPAAADAPDQGQAAPAGEGGAEADGPMRESATARAGRAADDTTAALASDGSHYDRPVPPAGVSPIGTLTQPGRAVVEGRVHTVEIRPVEHNTVLACDIADSTGELTALFYGRSNIPGLRPGSKVRLRGPVGMREGEPIMINPAYELLAQSSSTDRPDGGGRGRPRGGDRPDRRRRDDRDL
jgi:hypothetical protein